jgi:acetoin utilization protein AcuB
MLARALISDTIPPLKTSDSGTRAIDWMYEFKTSHLPLVDKGRYLGLVTEDDIIDFNHPDEPLSGILRSLYKPAVRDTDHLYEVLRVASEIESPLLPVVDAEGQYVGLITMAGLLRWFAAMTGIREEGGIVVIRLDGLKDYTLSDIARLVESNNAHVLSSFLRQVPETGEIQLTIKVNTTEIQHIVATLNRFEYTVEAYYREGEAADGLKDRYDALMNYLNI